MKLGSSGLTLREFQVYQQPAFELTPRKVTQWVKNLPMANLGESSKSTYRLLVDINQAIIDPDKRLAILTILEPVARHLVISLEKQFINNRIALTDKQKKIAALVQAIQTELSIGYHAVIEFLNEGEIKRSQRKLLVSALIMAIKYHGFVILRCYQLYASIPKRLWRELYCLYQIARSHEVDNQIVAIDDFHGKASVHSSFTQILLLSVASPYQLRQREIDLLWQILPDLLEHATLKTHAYNKHHYVIALNSAMPPVHKSLYKANDGDVTLKLTAFTTVEKLNQMLADIHGNDQQSSRKIMLLRHLIQCWNHGTHRAFARTRCHGNANISFGLGSTHFHLTHDGQTQNSGDGSTLEAMEGSLKHATLTEIANRRKEHDIHSFDYLSSSGPPDADVWAKLYKTDKEKEYEAAKQRMQQTHSRSRDTIVRDSYRSQSVDLLNMSPNGYCIEIRSSELPNHAQTGEILGFQEDGKEAAEQWNIGVVRWVRRQPKGQQVQMGVQLLAPGAKPINVQLRNSRSEANEYQRALMLPALTGVGQPATVLTNPISFSTNSKIRINENGKEYDARLSKELAATTSYRQFCFEKIGGSDKKRSPTGSPSPVLEPEELDGVWDLI